ncbi:MAG: hypothetical protein KGJ09_08160 [Candidatus Omnitrophica bacterium]|nr:hypothetical protein [Candidatus Omnitrophota bacterium]MDE2010034.1 hypothetical protein [Candidatus Omnitrophota bacterium]MDE2214731.1 hypothetical protein [Candidatus Omnitrophota bacterium]MDE2231786.1 hypothetical protein [Candidatus Omnitrophota bacterium]
MLKIYTGSKNFGFPLFFIIGTVLFLLVFFWGLTAIMEFFLPVLIVVAYLTIIVFVVGFLPATLIKPLRPTLSLYSLLMSHALGTATWILAFLFVIKAFGFFGILFAFLFKYLVFIALAGALFSNAWHVAEHLALWGGFAYGMKYYSQWLLTLDPSRPHQEGDIIDVDAREV